MKSIKTLTIIMAVAMAQIMTSCLKGEDNGYKIEDNYPNLYNAVVDQKTGEVTIYPSQSIKVAWMYGPNTATVQLNGLKLPSGVTMPTLKFDEVPFKINNRGWMDISMTDAVPVASSGFQSNLLFNDFNLQTISRQYANNGQTLTFPPTFVCNYTINNEYKVYALPMEIIEMGESTITDNNGNQYKPSNSETLTIYYIELDPVTKKGFVVIQGAKFDKNMPAMNMKFANIPFEVNAAGGVTMAINELVPSLMTGSDLNAAGTPAPQFPISNFRLDFTAERGVDITYNCVPTGKDGQPMGKYTVMFVSQYPSTAK